MTKRSLPSGFFTESRGTDVYHDKASAKRVNSSKEKSSKGDALTQQMTRAVAPLRITNRPHEKYMIGSIPVLFPFKAYPCQMSMMAKIIKTLMAVTSEHALLESPTGSGKSLSLLCSVLAWQQHLREKINSGVTGKVITDEHSEGKENSSCPSNSPLTASTASCAENPDSADAESVSSKLEKFKHKGNEFDAKLPSATGNEEPPVAIGKVYITSRTHKQISQLVGELRSTPYAPNAAVLGSRQHLCLKDVVLKHATPNEKCKELTDMGSCEYYHRAERLSKAMEGSVWDIEDIVEHGKRIKGCPYYASRDLASNADIIFAPYNYICEPDIRDAMQINLKNSVVVFDEAHNIEDSARDAGSFELTDEAIEAAAKELETLMILYNKPQHVSVEACSRDLARISFQLKKMLDLVYRWLTGSHESVQAQSDFTSQYYIWHGAEMVDVLNERIKLTQLTVAEYKTLFDELRRLEQTTETNSKELIKFPSTGVINAIGGILRILEKILSGDTRYLGDYKMAVIKSQSRYQDTTKVVWKWAFWCLNPGVIFKGLAKEVKSIILTSGTLSPMDSYASELQLDFSTKLEASHVIDKSQILVAAVQAGPSGQPTSGVYRNLESFAFQDDIGAAVLRYTELIPKGVLCFLPSYAFLAKVRRRWEDTGILDKLGQLKAVFFEPQRAPGSEFTELMNQYYENITGKPSKANLKKHARRNGAIMFAVYRGKISEGLDFSDDYARAVIAVGIPFPNTKDVLVQLKKEYNNKHSHIRNLLNGNQWYETQGFRALNQALGRCIRHRNDWGAIILFEERLAQQRYATHLSKWIRSSIQVHSTFQSSVQALSGFVDRWITEKEAPISSAITEMEPESATAVDDVGSVDLTQEEGVGRSSSSLKPAERMDLTGGSSANSTSVPEAMIELSCLVCRKQVFLFEESSRDSGATDESIEWRTFPFAELPTFPFSLLKPYTDNPETLHSLSRQLYPRSDAAGSMVVGNAAHFARSQLCPVFPASQLHDSHAKVHGRAKNGYFLKVCSHCLSSPTLPRVSPVAIYTNKALRASSSLSQEGKASGSMPSGVKVGSFFVLPFAVYSSTHPQLAAPSREPSKANQAV